VDDALGREVDERLVAWFEELGIFTDKLDVLRRQSYGRLIMLTHPDSDDPDQLMLAARWAVALWGADDVYADDETAGARPELVARRLALALAALNAPPLLGGYRSQMEEAFAADPIIRALRSSLEFAASSATPAQLNRMRHEVTRMFVIWNAEAAWRTAGYRPPVWEYLAGRQIDNFQPCMCMIDVVGGYELPAHEYADARVLRATALAASAAVVANDIYSMAKEGGRATDEFNLPTLIGHERGCSAQEAVDESVRYHEDLVRGFEAEHAALAAFPSPMLQRYLLGLRAWIGGNDEWHRTSGRYRLASGE
jgi:2-methylisoborneol synthase